ncbi:MAG TPA: preprotein translocase subunit YajC [Leptospiraceae bacterium]|jgi:preprotein translocase subunit YajC|nr:preprotein translocase subunit YajC [Leptospirales bacterium]HMU85778.1 preprotein translocase subunit YajC [Leptospiraceae bacterium]HMX58695.1 preprotein translocase subunit YajC [Leptospiraceae bacterium]HMY47009.1 preprotein translocase subunit YajC [Leptospiraceae bacterium]HNE23494.1 preprotein translocase subunit YajC [Leptospiraceae bacterium]
MEFLRFLAQQPAAPPTTEAPAQAPGAAAAGPGSSLTMFLLPVAIFAFMWLFVIRPQRKEEKKKREMVNTLKKGDEVVTTGGMIGTIATIKDDTVILNVGDKTRLEFMKSHISQMRETKKAEAK